MNDSELIDAIVERAGRMAEDASLKVGRLDVFISLQETHSRTPLKLRELLEADDFNFTHDVFGILRHIDHKTRRLRNCFVPRFAA